LNVRLSIIYLTLWPLAHTDEGTDSLQSGLFL
jgi:hypothetical protein